MNSDDLANFCKKFELPHGFTAPIELTAEGLYAYPLTRADLAEDLAAVNSSIETIQQTRGGAWPSDQLSEEFDLLDLAWHEHEFRDNSSFAYVLKDADKKYIGCFYLYPMGSRTALTELLLTYDVDASWWVTTEAYESGYYPKAFHALEQWLAEDLPFQRAYYSNKELI
jgi:RimJ/RimL family protein N-acetyltransferase